MQLSTQEQQFIDHVKKECKFHKIKFDLRKKSGHLRLPGNIKCSGYFDSHNKQLVVAAKREDFIEILAHEYCHLTQWAERCSEWVACEPTIDHIERWLSGENIRNVRAHIRNMRSLELDNEKRVIDIVRKFDLPVDTNKYIKKANGYVYFYTWMMKTRRWSTIDNSPYSNDTIINAMPEEFQDDYEHIPSHIVEVFESVGL